MRKLKSSVVKILTIIYILFVLIMNSILIYACIDEYYTGIYVVGCIIFITFISGYMISFYSVLDTIRFNDKGDML